MKEVRLSIDAIYASTRIKNKNYPRCYAISNARKSNAKLRPMLVPMRLLMFMLMPMPMPMPEINADADAPSNAGQCSNPPKTVEKQQSNCDAMRERQS